MKHSRTLKKLVDILFAVLVVYVGLMALSPVFALYGVEIKYDEHVDKGNYLHWFALILEYFVYLIFVRGIYFLRKVATSLLSNGQFTTVLIGNLKKSGLHLIRAGYLYIIVIAFQWLLKLLNGPFELEFSMSSILPVLILVVGLFFDILSNLLLVAKHQKEELDLIV